MSYKLSTKSQERLMGVEPELKEVVYEAIKLTKIDFGVIEGYALRKTKTTCRIWCIPNDEIKTS